MRPPHPPPGSDEAPSTATAPPTEEASLDDAAWTRRYHDLTHEVELIISAGLLFGLLQVPGRLDLWFDALNLRLDGTFWVATFVGWYYTKLIVLTLIGAFGLHILSRAYWVGLVGLDSAFPHGVRWDRLRYGPLAIETYRRTTPTVPTLARRADRFCSTIFSVAFLIVLIFAISIVLAAVVGGVALALARWVLPGVEPGRIWVVIMVTLGLGPVLAVSYDRWRGDRLDPEGRAARLIRRTVHWGSASLGGKLFLPIQFTLFSNLDRRVVWPVYLGSFVALVVTFLGGEVSRSGTFTVSPSELFPDRPGVRSVDDRYYADTRAGQGLSQDAPFIQSEMVTDPYVRLEIPLVARRHLERLTALCPDLEPLGRGGLVASRLRDDPPDAPGLDHVLSCVGGLWRTTLDGEPVELSWDFRSEVGLGVTGLVAYLPTASLEPGPHLLAIEEVFVETDEDGADDDEEPRMRRHFIRFWI